MRRVWVFYCKRRKRLESYGSITRMYGDEGYLKTIAPSEQIFRRVLKKEKDSYSDSRVLIKLTNIKSCQKRLKN